MQPGPGFNSLGDGKAAAMTGSAADMYGSATNGEGYTAEMVTDPNAAGTEQTMAETDGQDRYGQDTTNVANDPNYYDPAQYQNYYYQDEDGNYYYYPDQPQDMTTEMLDTTTVVSPNARNMVRSYEYEDWEPQTFGWFADTVIDTFMCTAFRLYLSVLLYCAAIFIGAVGLNYSFAVLFRLFAPPDATKSGDLQALGYLAMFFYVSFVIVSVLCALMDMARNLWSVKRNDVRFWGMSNAFFSKKKPPYIIYFCVIVVTVFLPLLWGIVEAGISKQSVLFVAQRYANVATLATVFVVFICYVFLYWRAVVYKRSAFKNRVERDDFRLREKAYKHNPSKMRKRHWYHALTVLEEFGMDGKTLRYNSIVFTVGLVPLFALYTAQTLSTFTGQPSVIWGAISSIALICVYIVAWLSLLHRKPQWSVYTSFTMDVVLFALGLAGSGAGGGVGAIGITIVAFVLCQGMVTRKRKHTLTRKEVCVALKIPYTPAPPKVTDGSAHFDTYLFCCRDVIINYLRCFNVKKHFGYTHPDIKAAQRQYSMNRIALRTDQKALLVWWLIVMFATAFSIGIGNAVQYRFDSTVAINANVTVNGVNPSLALCSVVYNENGSAPMKVYDLALLAALSYTYSTMGDADFATWFAQKPSLLRVFPEYLPPTLKFATNGIEIPFSDYVDLSTDFHFITLNSNSRGLAVFRDLDDWGESITLQVAGAVAPLFTIWPERYRRAFVVEGAFFKQWLPPSRALDAVSAYVENLIQQGAKHRILLIGDQFNGGYAKLLSSEYNVSFVAFNPPGVKYKVPFLPDGVQLSSVRSLWSYIDSLEDTSQTFYMPCDDDLMSASLCGRITTTLDYVLQQCGDEYGRSINDV